MRIALYALLSAALLGGCNQVIGLGEFSVATEEPGTLSDALQCVTHSECRDAASGSGAFRNEYCRVGHCVSLHSPDCQTVTGPANDSRALLIGSLFATSGAQAQTNYARQQSAMLAVEEINALGGVRLGSGNEQRPLVLVSCDSGPDLARASKHLIDDLGVKAIVGPNTSQDTLDLATQVSIASDVLLISPTAQASSIADLLDRDLSWLMVPSDSQRAPLLLRRIRDLEQQLRAERAGRPLKLGIVLRDDVLAQGARAALSTLDWNGTPVSNQDVHQEDVRIDSYDPAGGTLASLVAEYTAFAPDVIVAVGTAETVSRFMAPLEAAWVGDARPHYVVTDSSKVPELLELVRGNEALRPRVSGIGVLPTAEAAPNQAAFIAAYEKRYSVAHGSVFGTAQAYDAVYALTLAYASAGSTAGGEELARGLRTLYGGVTTFPLRPGSLREAQDTLKNGQALRAVGSFAPLRWDERGAVVDGTVDVFCLAASGGEPSYASSGLVFDIGSSQLQGTFIPCGSDVAPAPPPPVTTAVMPAQAAEAADTGAAAPPPAAMSDAADAGTASVPTEASEPTTEPQLRDLACGSSPCGANQSDYCCISGGTGTASCESQPTPCTYAFYCTRNADCAADEQCCELYGQARCIPSTDACPGAQFECTSARDCPIGNQCCSHLNADNTAYAATRCETSCAATNSSPLCLLPLDCDPGMVCRVSNYLPNLNVCDAIVR